MSTLPTPRTARTRHSTTTNIITMTALQDTSTHAAELTDGALTSGVFVAVRVRPLEALPSKREGLKQHQSPHPPHSHTTTTTTTTNEDENNNTNTEEGGVTSVPSSLSTVTPETTNVASPTDNTTLTSTSVMSNRCVRLYPGNVVECDFTAGHGRPTQEDATRLRPVFSMSCHAVFDEGSTQADVMESVGRRAVNRVLQGYHGTVLCYGQSGSGKTYTLLGPRGGVIDDRAVTKGITKERETKVMECDDKQDDNNSDNNDELESWVIREDIGLLVRMLHSLYTQLPTQRPPNETIEDDTQRNVKYEWHVTISGVELYNEKLRDLLPREQSTLLQEQQQQQYREQMATLKSCSSFGAYPVRMPSRTQRDDVQTGLNSTTTTTSSTASPPGSLKASEALCTQLVENTPTETHERVASPDPASPRPLLSQQQHLLASETQHGRDKYASKSQTRTAHATRSVTKNNNNTVITGSAMRGHSQGNALRRSHSRVATSTLIMDGVSCTSGSRTGCTGFNSTHSSTMTAAQRATSAAMSLARSEKDDIALVGLQKHAAPSFEAALQLLRTMLHYRTLHATLLNQNSNRAHTLFFIEVEQKYTTQPKEEVTTASNDSNENTTQETSVPVARAVGPTIRRRKAVLTLVDLAGSERVSQTGVEGIRLQEARKINLSLLCLGNVIRRITAQRGNTIHGNVNAADRTVSMASFHTSMADPTTSSFARTLNDATSGPAQQGQKKKPQLHSHIPYRDSKLTQLLQNSFGGNTITFVLCTISAAQRNAQETLSTLQFATMVKQVKNTATINSVMAASLTPAMASQLLHELRATQHEVARLRRLVQEKDAALATMALQLNKQQQQQQQAKEEEKDEENVANENDTQQENAAPMQEGHKSTITSDSQKEVKTVTKQTEPMPGSKRHVRRAVKELSVEALAARRVETARQEESDMNKEQKALLKKDNVPQQKGQYESIHMSPTTHLGPSRRRRQQPALLPTAPASKVPEADDEKEKDKAVQPKRQAAVRAKGNTAVSQAKPRVTVPPLMQRRHPVMVTGSLSAQEEREAKTSRWNQLMSHIKTVLHKHGRTTAQ